MSSFPTEGAFALQERDAALERWLSAKVAPIYDRMEADPTRGISPEDMAARARRRHEARELTDPGMDPG